MRGQGAHAMFGCAMVRAALARALETMADFEIAVG
jgi:hypothetical protein